MFSFNFLQQAILAAAVALAISGPALAADPVTLTAPNKPCAVVYAFADADEIEQNAAAELARVLGVMSGQPIEVLLVDKENALDATRPALVLGRLAEKLGMAMELKSEAEDGYRYAVRGNRLLVVGESPRGVYHGVFAFLEELGCGWYTPQDIGEVIPRRATVSVAGDLDKSEVSDSIYRRFWYGGAGTRGRSGNVNTWSDRNRGRNTDIGMLGTHGGLLPDKKLFDERPELFGYIRSRDAREPRQPCTTHPDAARIVAEQQLSAMRASKETHPGQRIFSAGPHDGYRGRCECETCMAVTDLNYIEPTSGKPDDSDLLFTFVDKLARATQKEFPENFLSLLIYADYSRVPRTLQKLSPNVFPVFAPIRRCRLHGPGNPNCELAKLWQEEIRAWGQLTENLAFYVYNYNLADSLLPLNKLSFFRRLQAEVKQLTAAGQVKRLGWIFETIDSWSQHAPHLYLSTRLMWRSDVDLDAEYERFITGFYGAAADPMRSYWLRVDAAYAQADVHVGSSYGQHLIWTDEVLKGSRVDLNQAAKRASNDRERAAVAMADAGLRCAELFVGIRRAINDGRFLVAQRLHRQLKAHTDKMVESAWAHGQYVWGYYNRFIGRTVEGGAKFMLQGGRVLAQMPDVWKFTTDKDGDGVQRGLFRPDFDDSNWRDLHTYNGSWIDQGLLGYFGQAWYRTTFTLPDFPADADLRLWFGGFDENVDVYLNGHHLGEKRGFATPAEFDNIRAHLKPGGKNVLAVRVDNIDVAEIGTGGIMMPVVIYQVGAEKPRADDDKPEPGEAEYIIG